MKDASTLPNMDGSTANRDRGVMRDDTVPGDGNGTPVREDWQQDMYYALRAVLDAAGKTPDDSEEGVVQSQFLDSIIKIAEPVGTILTWDKSFPNTPTLPAWYVECDGSLISDSDSPFNGYRSRNLNGGNVVLSLSWTADAGGAYATVAATDVTALAVGDKVTGSGITPVSGDNHTYITDITGTTVTIGDVAASGTISSTFTNDGRFIRGGSASGVGEIDELQSHTMAVASSKYLIELAADELTAKTGSDARYSVPVFHNRTDVAGQIAFPFTDTVNGNPRTGEETRPINTKEVYIMKIK